MDAVHSQKNLASLSAKTIQAAKDEVTNFKILQGLDDFADFTNIEHDINVLEVEVENNGQVKNLDAVINDPANADLAAFMIKQRCCEVLPAIDQFWTTASSDEGVSDKVDLAAPRPSVACGSIQCPTN